MNHEFSFGIAVMGSHPSNRVITRDQFVRARPQPGSVSKRGGIRVTTKTSLRKSSQMRIYDTTDGLLNNKSEPSV